MKVMKVVNFFLILPLLLSGCKKQEPEEIIDLDTMVMAESELDTNHLAGEPVPSPQELLIKEPASVE